MAGGGDANFSTALEVEELSDMHRGFSGTRGTAQNRAVLQNRLVADLERYGRRPNPKSANTPHDLDSTIVPNCNLFAMFKRYTNPVSRRDHGLVLSGEAARRQGTDRTGDVRKSVRTWPP